jgi:hypothetical protein
MQNIPPDPDVLLPGYQGIVKILNSCYLAFVLDCNEYSGEFL